LNLEIHQKDNIISSKKRSLGQWLCADETIIAQFRNNLALHVKNKKIKELLPSVEGLATLVNENSVLRMNFTLAIEQALEAGYDLGYTSSDELMAMINEVVTSSIAFDKTYSVGVPLYALLQWPLRMTSGLALFRDDTFNQQLKQVLNDWCQFLNGSDSRDYLNEQSPSGWFSPDALAEMDMSEFICDPTLKYWGYSSWNDFFTRKFKAGARPVAGQRDKTVVVNACEATAYNIQYDVQLQDQFWIKSQPYSLGDIFTASRRQWAELFQGGAVYQAYLSQFNYHRWNAPISGAIVDAYLVDGSYYSDADVQAMELIGPLASQGYMSSVVARAVVLIESGDETMGIVACIFVGMAEISSCVIEVDEGDCIEKGDELGYFQYGGSTYCVIFQAGAISDFIPKPPFDEQPLQKLNSQLAIAN
jgi:phosphatidylserine decarboxylase